jgi:hypothetical protein
MRLLKKLLFLGLFMFTNCASTNSQSSSDWNLLGEKKVDYAPDRDVIIVNSNPKYNKIKVKVLNGRVLIQDMKVEFGDGDIMDVSLKYAFDEGGYSRDIDLPQGNRHIKKIFFRYRTSKNSFEKGIVQVWGSK